MSAVYKLITVNGKSVPFHRHLMEQSLIFGIVAAAYKAGFANALRLHVKQD